MVHLRLSAIILSLALGAAEQPQAPDHWYLGWEARTSPDGMIPYGTDPEAFKREVLEDGVRILETFTQPGRSPSSPAVVSHTVLRRRGNSLVYDAEEDRDGFAGIYTFNDVHLNTWTCDLKGRNGASLTGRGDCDGLGLRTRYLLVRPGLAMLLEGTCQAVPEREYETRVAGMRPRPGAE